MPRVNRPAPEAEGGALLEALDWVCESLLSLAPLVANQSGPPRPLWDPPAGNDVAGYLRWLAETAPRLCGESLPGVRATEGPLISVLVPVFRPTLWWFRSCVESVKAQTYSRWELCICDDGSRDPALGEYLQELARSDPRIRLVSHPDNVGISRATNSALGLAAGEFVALLDHDDLLDPHALAEVALVATAYDDADVVYSDEDKVDQAGRFEPQFKPDWSPDLLLSTPYLGHLVALRRDLLLRIGGFRPEFDGSQDFDVMLRATEVARRVVHVPKVLYHWRCIEGSAAGDPEAKPWAHLASRRVLEETVRRRGLDAEVEDSAFRGWYHLRRRIAGRPSVAIVIPFRDQAEMTAKCLASIEATAGYDNFEIVLVDNDSIEPETRALRARLDPSVRVVEHPGVFNWAAINNSAVASSSSDLLLFLNNDIEGSRPGWLTAMVEQAQRPEVGAVGARLLYPDGTIQHAGVVLGINGIAWHLFPGLPKDGGYFGWDRVIRQFSAVTGACMMTRRSVVEEVGRFDESLAVGLNDIDYCMRVVDAGYRVIYTPLAELVHHESISRGILGVRSDTASFLHKWGRERLRRDPFYNPNLSLFGPWCSLRRADETERWEALVDELSGERAS